MLHQPRYQGFVPGTSQFAYCRIRGMRSVRWSPSVTDPLGLERADPTVVRRSRPLVALRSVVGTTASVSETAFEWKESL